MRAGYGETNGQVPMLVIAAYYGASDDYEVVKLKAEG